MTTYVVTDYDGCDYITAGKRYEARPWGTGGFRITGDHGFGVDILQTGCAHLDGREWTVIEEPDTPKTWGEMTDAEKGALLLAHHEGKVIECSSLQRLQWVVIEDPAWMQKAYYRIKQEPVVGELVLSTGQPDFFGWAAYSSSSDTHTITLPTLDGNLVTGEFTNEDGMKVVIEEKQK